MEASAAAADAANAAAAATAEDEDDVWVEAAPGTLPSVLVETSVVGSPVAVVEASWTDLKSARDC